MKHLTASYQKWTHRLADKIRLDKHPFIRVLITEALGTMTLVIFGVGVSAQAYITEGQFGDMLDICIGYAAARCLGLFVAGKNSEGMCNPCIAFAQCLVGRLEFTKMLAYWCAEFVGAYIGNLLIISIYYEKIKEFAVNNDNGLFLMNSTGSIFSSTVNATPGELVVDQVIVGAIVMVGVMAALDKNNWNLPRYLIIVYISTIQFLLLDDFSTNTTSNNNPALDFGGRLALITTGWGTAAFSYKNYVCFVFFFGPLLGTLIGVLFYELLIGIHLPGAGVDLTTDVHGQTPSDVQYESDDEK